jgi:hypothetical protein
MFVVPRIRCCRYVLSFVPQYVHKKFHIPHSSYLKSEAFYAVEFKELFSSEFDILFCKSLHLLLLTLFTNMAVMCFNNLPCRAFHHELAHLFRRQTQLCLTEFAQSFKHEKEDDNIFSYNLYFIKSLTNKSSRIYTSPPAIARRISDRPRHTRVYPKVSRLAAWSENCKWYSSLPLGAVVSLLCESV